ncbi:MAG: secondary thiamine-phosphate synthase enzyme YjbQ [Calditrichaeota bacterium]|nr:secondary thiamine-phosphate synthase enzyme YjbQ [Candidatus Cloacimonadota bacterium]MCB1048383.1 secondary thiamine-phosphate synthase enzyme YjbQ [Calditrichota bacterium]MCB9474981.1 YjbQ family protein [Candidatus Delongbacteria bacterium]
MVHTHEFSVATNGRGFTDLGPAVRKWLASLPRTDGLCHVFVAHTSASLILCENADPRVRQDLECWFADSVQDGDPRFRHRDEGPDDMAAHLRSVLTSNSLSLPVRSGSLALGTWQGLYLWEHRTRAHSRRVLLTLVGQ